MNENIKGKNDDKNLVDINKKSFAQKNVKHITNELFLKYNTLVGHKLKFTKPEMYENVFGINFTNNLIFDLNKTIISLRRTLNFLKYLKKNEGIILFVGTRHDIKNIIKKIGIVTNSPYVNDRWLKGLLTNWENVSNSIRFYNLFFKKLDIRSKQKRKMKSIFEGLGKLNRLPDAIVLLDANTDTEALREAHRLNIPVIGITDTNSPINKIDYPILGNTESILSIIFFANLIISSLKMAKK